jgi:hypothetical protein
MDIDEDDDFYAPSEDVPTGDQTEQMRSHAEVKPEEHDDDLEEGEEEDEGEEDGSDSVWINQFRAQKYVLTRTQGY